MYEFLKMLQPVAEQIGAVKEIRLYTGDQIMGNQISIEGIDKSGRSFELELTIREEDDVS